MAQALHNSCYSRSLVINNWHPTTTTPHNHDQNTQTTIVNFPYICHLSKTIRRILSLLGIRTCFQPHCILRQTLAKDPTPLQCRAGVVYRIPCGTCPKVYVGQTGKTLEHRLKNQKRALTSGNVSQLAVVAQANGESHAIKWEEAEVVSHRPRYQQRYVLEA